MHLTLNSLTALRIIRSARTGALPIDLRRRCDFIAPALDNANRWSRSALHEVLQPLGSAGDFSQRQPLHILCPSKDTRPQVKGVKPSVRSIEMPPGAFVPLGGGIAIASPELAFVELAQMMDPTVHLLLGMELCGSFSRSPIDAQHGRATYGLPAVTTVSRLRTFAQEGHAIRGARKALATIDGIVENAWSPMEAIIAALLITPVNNLGYGLWPITLNARKDSPKEALPYMDKASRVPDIMFNGTHVGINYDGDDHFGLEEIARAATAAAMSPGNAQLAAEVGLALADARRRIIDDKRRDRDLEALGYTVASVTKEDLFEPGGLDKVVGQVFMEIRREDARTLFDTGYALTNTKLARLRQDFIWSLLPGPGAEAARKRLAQVPNEDRPQFHSCWLRVA